MSGQDMAEDQQHKILNKPIEKVGVIIVHGIGEQKRFEFLEGETRKIVDAIIAKYGKRRRDITPTLTPGSGDAFLGDQPSWVSGTAAPLPRSETQQATWWQTLPRMAWQVVQWISVGAALTVVTLFSLNSLIWPFIKSIPHMADLKAFVLSHLMEFNKWLGSLTILNHLADWALALLRFVGSPLVEWIPGMTRVAHLVRGQALPLLEITSAVVIGASAIHYVRSGYKRKTLLARADTQRHLRE